MNIEKFRWPVIIAAGLHGALFLGSPDANYVGRILHGKDATGCPIDPPPVVAWDQPEDGGNDGPAGGAVGPSLPDLPDKPVNKLDDSTFKLPVLEQAKVYDKVTRLADVTGRPPGPGGNWEGPTGPAITGVKDLDRVPRATFQPEPAYPPTLRQSGTAGSVTVEFDVNTEGRVVRATAVGYTHREFADPAVRAVRNWRFEPGRRNGKTVPFRMIIPIEFGIEGR